MSEKKFIEDALKQFSPRTKTAKKFVNKVVERSRCARQRESQLPENDKITLEDIELIQGPDSRARNAMLVSDPSETSITKQDTEED